MNKNNSDKILDFYDYISSNDVFLPSNYKLINPFLGDEKDRVRAITKSFYSKYYSDNHPRKMILGSSPARRGSAVLGVPFEEYSHLLEITGIKISNFYVSKNSSDFLAEVIKLYGGYDKFYYDFYLNFVCPLGIAYINEDESIRNSNYYENKRLQESLYSFMVDSIKKQIDMGIDTSVCYSIGSGENYKFLLELNKKYNFFKKIVPLPHPRFIMQYNKKDKDKYIKMYLDVLKNS